MPLERPFLKWAGAKTKLLSVIGAHVPAGTRRLVEPFVGSGAVALNLALSRSLLADTNRDVISVYTALRDDGESFIDACGRLFVPGNNRRRAYYALRAEFNGTRDTRRRAALFVYLNRHGYNGLCRYNRRGELNVPFGRYEGPRLPSERMRVFHAFLQTCELQHADFRPTLARCGPGDFVYCDPPYVPSSDTANFTTYTGRSFTARDQADLAVACQAAASRGACVVVSNHDAPLTRELYGSADETHELSVARRISCQSATRTPARELLAVFRPRAQTTDTDPPVAA